MGASKASHWQPHSPMSPRHIRQVWRGAPASNTVMWRILKEAGVPIHGIGVKQVRYGDLIDFLDIPPPSEWSEVLDGDDGLTPRQREAYELARQGLNNAEIGRRMGIKGVSAKNHLVQAKKKIGWTHRRTLT